MIVKAYAKVNFILNVLGRRPDGYHEIETVFQAIGLFDKVRVTPGPYRELPFGRENLACKALRLMKDYYGHPFEDYCIEIEKNIPEAAGLAGGSADGAAVMTALAAIWGIPVDDKMYALAAELGSDVPFCLAAQNGFPAAIARGRGEKLEYIAPTDCMVELKLSEVRLANKTARVYGALEPEDYAKPFDTAAFAGADSLPEKAALMGNHLQAPLERLTGISAPGWILCGAGPTYFRVWSKEQAPEGAIPTVL